VRRFGVALLLLAGCLRLANYHARCAEDGDCPGGTVCEAQLCVDACVESPDSCPVGQGCQGGHCMSDGTCASDSQCQRGQICDTGKCVAGCRHTADCDFAHDMGCIDSVCQPAKLCLQTLDCTFPQVCLDSVCMNRPCGGSNGSCRSDLECKGGRCVQPAAASACGEPGQPCCASFRCNNGCCVITASRSFACVGDGASCNDADGSHCRGSTGGCDACGDLTQRCCTGPTGERWCSSANTACEPSTVTCKFCGLAGQACCRTDSSLSARVDPNGCDPGLVCVDDGLGYRSCRK
jgi:hypothetical protein